jgi:hypothetical protein
MRISTILQQKTNLDPHIMLADALTQSFTHWSVIVISCVGERITHGVYGTVFHAKIVRQTLWFPCLGYIEQKP